MPEGTQSFARDWQDQGDVGEAWGLSNRANVGCNLHKVQKRALSEKALPPLKKGPRGIKDGGEKATTDNPLNPPFAKGGNSECVEVFQ